jgi:hypothetical protein
MTIPIEPPRKLFTDSTGREVTEMEDVADFSTKTEYLEALAQAARRLADLRRQLPHLERVHELTRWKALNHEVEEIRETALRHETISHAWKELMGQPGISRAVLPAHLVKTEEMSDMLDIFDSE